MRNFLIIFFGAFCEKLKKIELFSGLKTGLTENINENIIENRRNYGFLPLQTKKIQDKNLQIPPK